jgi:CubicO group peptidase (beta-lactamase class C family)/D-alanyl-D-alanine dipeptidase
MGTRVMMGVDRFLASNGWVGRGALVWIAAFSVLLSSGFRARAGADQVVAADERHLALVRQLEPWIAAEVQAKKLPALSIALVDDQQTVWARGFGFADAAGTVPATADTVYRVGSVSKLFTDLAVMQLVEQGRLDLDTPVSRILPEFMPVNPFKVPITLRHLMSHRAGLVREPPVGHYFDPNQPSLSAVVKSLAATTLLFEPGTRTKYSNAGLAVVGAVVERVVGKSFPTVIDEALLKPLKMTQSSFEPAPDLASKLAHGVMWTYDGQTIATPKFLLGTGPAGNMVSSVNDLGRFVSFVFAGGRGPSGAVVKPETLRSMIEPAPTKAGESAGFGLGFAISKLDGERRIGHNGAVYGFASEVAALPDSRLGVVVITSVDCANGIASHIATSALRMMLGARKGRPPVAPVISKHVSRERAKALKGHYASGANSIDIVDRDGRLLLSPFAGMTVEIKGAGDSLMIDDRLVSGPRLETGDDRVRLGGTRYQKTPAAKPAPSPGKWDGLIGEYGWDHDVLYILERDGKLHALIEWFFDYPLKEVSPDRFAFPDFGLYAGESLIFSRDSEGKAAQVDAASVVFKRRHLDGEGGKTFRIVPRRPIEEVRREIRSARPPVEAGTFRRPDLVELISLDPAIKLDIRYATTNNFLSVPCYTSARAFMERPAAEALLRAHRALARQGYGLLIHDAYRPWQITKLFWEATPDSGRMFVANPAKGSKHNRGAAVDLTLYELATGEPVKMVGGYDEMSPRSFPDYPGGTSLERWHREVLREAMEGEGFTVNEFEWWHFDHRDWKEYPIIDLRFEDLAGLERAK